MCGIFGGVSKNPIELSALKKLANFATTRGQDSSGIVVCESGLYRAYRADFSINSLFPKALLSSPTTLIGHSRLVTNGNFDNQPVQYDGIFLIHNGIVLNTDELWSQTDKVRHLQIDSEIIAALLLENIEAGLELRDAAEAVLDRIVGVAACAVLIPALGKLLLFSNNGSLYKATYEGALLFSSERYPLEQINAQEICQVTKPELFDADSSLSEIKIEEWNSFKHFLVADLVSNPKEEALLLYERPDLTRCTKCILPSTMPFIYFDAEGICNYCNNYQLRNVPKPKSQLFELVEKYRRVSGEEVVVPFSGGRDSCYGLHLIVKELGLKPITYTYDWGMVTDLGRRNISRMSSSLGVENIVVAANINKKRDNISKNLRAWLKAPDLGMLSVLTAGDKHFFKYVEQIKNQTGVQLNLWGINPLEVTHFKSGFLGVPPDFEESSVYSHGLAKQLRYQSLRVSKMVQSPGYFNSSLWDTLSGEYYRSFTKKKDYFHIFDYWRWDEEQIDSTLINEYGWETATDTSTTWRIGDGTAAFYNYVYYTVAGFTEHDTFRSNQIREGEITREMALRLVEIENKPRYSNLRWYLDILGFDFAETVSVINKIPQLY